VTVNLYTFVDLHRRALETVDHLLTRGLEHAAATGATEADVLGWRLIEDMQPFSFQIMVVVNFARQWPARVAGLPVPEAIGADLDVAGLRAAIAEAKAYMATLTPERFEGRDEEPLTYQIVEGMAPTMPSGRWLSVFSTPNLYFHVTTAYAILRAKGVALGKTDFFAAGL
jgi:hypothetical protein